VEFKADSPKNPPNEPDLTAFVAALTSLVPVVAAVRRSRPATGNASCDRQSLWQVPLVTAGLPFSVHFLLGSGINKCGTRSTRG